MMEFSDFQIVKIPMLSVLNGVINAFLTITLYRNLA